MIITTVTFSVAGDTYEQIVTNAKVHLSEFFDINIEDVEKKANIEIKVSETFDSTDFEDDNYLAQVIAQVKNV